ncbi:MAG: TIM barrel protein [Bacteroidia bacterium]|nr:TIM barrel protein [Bacteroidia bacterium]
MNLKGNLRHSVSFWCFQPYYSLEEFCPIVKEIGLQSIELTGPDEWPILQKHGLTCAIAQGSFMKLEEGFNDPQNHPWLHKGYESFIPLAAEHGLPHVICFSGNRNGLSDETAIENFAQGIDPLVKLAEKHGITLVSELLNSRVDHPDFHCDHSDFGVKLIEKVGSPNLKLLYDIYHMQIMEGDIIATIRKCAPYIAHYHTAGVPGRHEIEDDQELNYPAIMRTIVATGYKGFIGQEFVPTRPDPVESLREAVRICDV